MLTSHNQHDPAPPCPTCGSTGRLSPEHDRMTYAWECGAWANVKEFKQFGEAAFVDYNSDCEWRIEVRRLSAEGDRMRSALNWIIGYATERNLSRIERQARAALTADQETTR